MLFDCMILLLMHLVLVIVQLLSYVCSWMLSCDAFRRNKRPRLFNSNNLIRVCICVFDCGYEYRLQCRRTQWKFYCWTVEQYVVGRLSEIQRIGIGLGNIIDTTRTPTPWVVWPVFHGRWSPLQTGLYDRQSAVSTSHQLLPTVLPAQLPPPCVSVSILYRVRWRILMRLCCCSDDEHVHCFSGSKSVTEHL